MRATDPVPGSRGAKGELSEASMEPERKGLWSASSNGDGREENKLKQGISQDLASSSRLDRYKIARQLTEKAIKEKKIFSIYGHYPVVRAALRRKGWVEKKFHFLPKVIPDVEDEGAGVADVTCGKVKENQEMALEKTDDIHNVMSRLVKNEMPYLLWTIKRDAIDYHSLTCDQMLNHYAKTASFTTKIGLCVNMRSLPWYVPANPDSFFPRCYSLCTESEQQEFLEDFRRTMASSILKWVVSHQSCSRSGRSKPRGRREEAGNSDLSSRQDAKNAEAKLRGLPGQLVDIACKVCQAYLGQLEHEDIDTSADATEDLTEAEWEDLTQQYYSLVHGDAFISDSRNYFPQCQALLNQITSVNPQTDIDGFRNIWIIKPAAKSRGRDIVCMDRVEEILELAATDHPLPRDNKWVVQKYIETPLLIYDTKFDIRQWFLVTDWNPLTIWFYKESYLRFSTQRFSLDKLDSAIHLCNNAVQKHLKNDVGRSPLLPAHNMWTSAKFQEYLQRQGRGAVWGSVIYPSMKKAIIHAMKVAQDHVEPRKNSFELYGADFVLGRDFRPWLIEINSSPTMHPSTPVTAQLCAQVQEDTIKVAVDRSCDVGNFELLWRQPVVELPPFSGSDLCVAGVSVRRARRQVLPACNLKASALLLDTQPLEAQGPSAMPDPAQGSPRPALQRDLGLKEEKGHPLALLAPLRGLPESSGAPQPTRNKAAGKVELSACPCRHVDSQAPNTDVPKAQPTKHWDPNQLNAHPPAPVPQSLKTVEGALRPPPGGKDSFICELLKPPAGTRKVLSPTPSFASQSSTSLLVLTGLSSELACETPQSTSLRKLPTFSWFFRHSEITPSVCMP
ncbi:protein monoglycylase TTLL8 isoform X1 [Papio anubis]|uniref:protein monoglycylase TTLL8 isoform X1 n=2 Tax=Papio anubis TaxID=9555 RepID=UPI0012AE19CD|nr:protein monoglycylase TTLL8 isoform X1 [Papio anubis]